MLSQQTGSYQISQNLDEEDNIINAESGLLTDSAKTTNTETPLVFILVGKCGSGKSSTANTLLGETRFEALRSASSVTLGCQTASLSPVPIIKGKHSRIIIMDTPGLGDPEVNREDNLEEIKRGVNSLKSAYPNARFSVVLVCGLQARISEDDLKEFGYLGSVFGLGFYRHSVMVWTHGDVLEEVKGGLEGYFSKAGDALGAFIEEIQGGEMVIDNSIFKTGALEKSEMAKQRETLLNQLVEISLPVLGSGRDIELKGKKARRLRQAELAKKRASTAHNESFLHPLMENISTAVSNITTSLRQLIFG
mmetsp:Transcript_20336/g.26384  ORF Transcript_20336/g.26384 Transcript_20336/m.26384 type:complete len:307 (+) Transcript_20336:196-1116(+)